MEGDRMVIVGAGGHGKVVLDILLKQRQILGTSIEVIGFVDDDRSKKKVLDIPIIGTTDDLKHIYNSYKSVYFVLAIGDNKVRKEITEKYEGLNFNYYTAIHPTAIIGNYVTIGEGTVVMAGAVVNSNTNIGKHAIINTLSVIGHDNNIEDFAHIASGARCVGGVTVKKGAYVYAGATIIPEIVIGENAVIGAGSVVINDVPPNCTCVGVPAKVIKLHHNWVSKEEAIL